MIRGGLPLKGEVAVSGSKNASLAILAGALLASEGETVLRGLPRIGDVETMAQVLQHLGATARFEDGGCTLHLNAENLTADETPADLVNRMRASFWTLGPLLARRGRARIAQPGGCNIGARPIDLHIKGLTALGADIDQGFGALTATTARRLTGATVYLDFASVGATMNIMMAAALANGETIIENAAQEPDIEDLGNFLNAMGANISGHGTGVLIIRGVRKLHGAEYTVSTDRMEAGTLGIAAGITGGDVFLRGANAAHMRPITLKMREAGMIIEESPEGIRCAAPVGEGWRPVATNITASPHPGFPTDMQQTFTAMLCLAEGTSVITDNVYESRFHYLTELAKMGAHSTVNGRTAVISGVKRLTGADVEASDLRAGAAMVTAGLAAQGQTRVFKTEHLDRGYERLHDKLAHLGAEIWREDELGRRLETSEKTPEKLISCSHV